MKVKARQIQLLSVTNKLLADITKDIKDIDIKVYGDSVESIKLLFKNDLMLSNILQTVHEENIPLGIKIDIGEKKEFFYLTPKYCWVNEQMESKIIERGIAPCQAIVFQSKYYAIFINKRVPKRIGQELKLKLGYSEAINIIKKIIGKEEIKKYLAKDIQYKLNEKLTCALGQCKTYDDNSVVIEISASILKYSEKVLTTIFIHEILHAFSNTKGHNKIWKQYAKLITDNSIYRITRCSNPEAIEKGFRYKLICLDCQYDDELETLNKEDIKKIDAGKSQCPLCEGTNVICFDTETGREYRLH